MVFYDGFIKEIKKLENKYYEVNILYIDGKARNELDLYNSNGELVNIEIKNEDERDFLKVLIYSYALKKYSDINGLEPITNNFEIGNATTINATLLKLEKKNINIEKHVEKFKNELNKNKEEGISLFFKELYEYYLDNENITEEYLDMNMIQEGITKEESYKKLRKLLFKYTAKSIILNSSKFEELNDNEKKIAKYSILFGSLENKRCREIIGGDLKEISEEYQKDNLIDEEKIMLTITAIGDVYNYFSNKFRKSTNGKSGDFSQVIENFEELLILKDRELEKMNKETKEENKTTKVEKSKIPNFSAERFENKKEIKENNISEKIEQIEEIEEKSAKLEILVDSIKSAKESKDEIEENEELHKVIDSLIPAKDMVKKMKIKKQQEIIGQVKEITDKLKSIEEGSSMQLDFKPLEDVIKILEDKGYEIQSREGELYLIW